jgi:hypothetical protein
VRAEKKKLDLLLYKARLFNSNPLSSVPVWLYFNADGESAKRSLVLDGSTEILRQSSASISGKTPARRMSPLLD